MVFVFGNFGMIFGYWVSVYWVFIVCFYDFFCNRYIIDFLVYWGCVMYYIEWICGREWYVRVGVFVIFKVCEKKIVLVNLYVIVIVL